MLKMSATQTDDLNLHSATEGHSTNEVGTMKILNDLPQAVGKMAVQFEAICGPKFMSS